MKKRILLLMTAMLLLCMGLCACVNRNDKTEESRPTGTTAEVADTTAQTESTQVETEPYETEGDAVEEPTVEIEATEPKTPVTNPPITAPPAPEPPATELPETSLPDKQPGEDEFPEIPVC